MVLRPVPPLIDAVVRDGVCVPVAETTKPVGKCSGHVIRQLVAIAAPQRQQTKDVEIRAIQPPIYPNEPPSQSPIVDVMPRNLASRSALCPLQMIHDVQWR